MGASRGGLASEPVCRTVYLQPAFSFDEQQTSDEIPQKCIFTKMTTVQPNQVDLDKTDLASSMVRNDAFLQVKVEINMLFILILIESID